MPKTKPTYAESLKRISDADDAIKEALAKKRHLIEQSKVIAYDTLSALYNRQGQELIDVVTKEHELIVKLMASGMTYEQIAELADGDADHDDIDFYDNDSDDDVPDGQLSFDDEKKNPYAD